MERLVVTTVDKEIYYGQQKEEIFDKDKELKEFLKDHSLNEDEVWNVGIQKL